jgi:hypothetical protein
MPRWHQDHQPVDLAALDALQVGRYKAVVGRSAIAGETVLSEADQPIALLFELLFVGSPPQDSQKKFRI